MKFISSRTSKKTLNAIAGALLIVALLLYDGYERFIERKTVVTTIEPWNFTSTAIVDIYVNGKWGGAVGGHRGGGSSICCALIPEVWRENLVVKVEWKKTNDKKWYTKAAPVPKYTEPASLQVLFFSEDTIKVFVDDHWPCSRPHPMQPKIELCKQ